MDRSAADTLGGPSPAQTPAAECHEGEAGNAFLHSIPWARGWPMGLPGWRAQSPSPRTLIPTKPNHTQKKWDQAEEKMNCPGALGRGQQNDELWKSCSGGIIYFKGISGNHEVQLFTQTGPVAKAGLGACPSVFLVSLTKLPATWEMHFSLVMVTLPIRVTLVYLQQWFPDPKRAPVPPLNIKFSFIDKLRIARDLLCKFCLVLNIDTPSPYCGWYIKMQRVWIPQQQLALGTGPVPFN